MVPVWLLSFGVLALVGWYTLYTERTAVARVENDFAERAVLTGQLTASALRSSDRQNREAAEQLFGGDAASIRRALDTPPVAAFGVVLTPDGTVLAAQTSTPLTSADVAMSRAVAAQAQRNSRMTFSDFVRTPRETLLLFGVPFSAAGQKRIWVGSAPIDTVDTFASGFLAASLDVKGGRSYIVDGHGLVVARSGRESLATPLPDARVLAALGRAAQGRVGDSYFTSATVPGSPWRVVFVASSGRLLQPIQATRRLAWEMFGGFAVAVLGGMILASFAVTRSARLSHERRHDALTGLPNRGLFIEQADRLLAASARRGTNAVMLFVDLDGFKPINDRFGHAAGDDLLVAVARRLRDAARPEDVLCRFGGDEFLLLCPGIGTEEDAVALGERIRQRIAEPYDLTQGVVRVGSSIGVAMPGPGAESAASLIQRADQAMYDAKRSGRGAVAVSA